MQEPCGKSRRCVVHRGPPDRRRGPIKIMIDHAGSVDSGRDGGRDRDRASLSHVAATRPVAQLDSEGRLRLSETAGGPAIVIILTQSELMARQPGPPASRRGDVGRAG